MANDFEEAREWCMGLGITDGTRPYDKATREEVWAMLYRFAKIFHHNKIRP